MSLKVVHVVFIAVCVVLSAGFAFWAIRQYLTSRDLALLVCGIFSILGGVGMLIYGRWFLRKLRGISYL